MWMFTGSFVSLFVTLFWISNESEAYLNISCYECEIVDRERQHSLWPCDGSMGPWEEVQGCRACVKIEETQRIDFRKPRWGQEYFEVVTESRLCLRKFVPLHMDTCTQTYGSASAQKKCYCSTPFCNKSSSVYHFKWLLLSVFVSSRSAFCLH
ncbi:uncharacterized protein DEA37_0002586 [Paragonimus westermani]|uniref:Protein quiver n=1 Tax=Paragonimus westermani TaxID=34504 RepID=A0A5J4NJD0_9TREM|nr:uncharacterized protein DEA37_0002586 [Paragonimus westermani]